MEDATTMSQIKEMFPLAVHEVNGQPLVYLDSAATTLKPEVVIDRMEQFYRYQTANVHRGAHFLSDRATEMFEQARSAIASFINANSSSEIVFTRGTTESINLVAQSFGRSQLKPGDEIILTEMEHHSNIVPWQLVAEATGAVIKVIPVDDSGDLVLTEYEKLLSRRTKIVSVVVCSNSLGTVNPVKAIIEKAKTVNATVVLDAAQSISALPTDVQDLDCDFLAFSGHKIFGPYGIGVLYGKEELLNRMPPYQGGGSMIDTVSFKKTTFLQAPTRFEAGTPNISGAIGLGTAIEFVNSIGLGRIKQHEEALLSYATKRVSEIPGLSVIGTSPSKANILSFLIDEIHPADVASLLDQQGVAVRSGHHCCQPLMERFKIRGTLRASFSVYNNASDVDVLVAALKKAKEFF
ncbi:MAG: cysteine desulfurase [Pseudobdellovibrionaceae bacterium]|nr:cysteine desulfurase [Bdellovibrionales bacterium]USN46994.1 MAG: cysteine desulfurase [Pseudobdellovibrionaceae bacterium]